MQFLNGITLLLVYQLAGEIIVRLLGVSIPGPVLGMVMLFVTMMIRGRAPESVEQASTGLLSHLSLLFVPAGVGMITHFGRIADEWLPITLALLLSTVITMVATALIMQQTSRWFTKTGQMQGQNDE
ncbi:MULTISPECIES: CidA/LrgA family protein [unclassified Marinobacter]|uniref:CidA/LrgA family protein n=1 Tax=unclassified Marinobacter TaxID=83889 RepID=UPI0026E482A9|nr:MULTISPECIES: CidA/LrgA family protein [unclassified Marinobacter]MDO6442969.1 CidA/LrgA family protein [Marinobacter sp. 2_MG-2023]MDO6822817.1 CidA/LrgA family protein [Marinobacter sp. 1_MG-2023]